LWRILRRIAVNHHQVEVIEYLQEDNRIFASISMVVACASPTPSVGSSPRRAERSADVR
jgi:hypothetical protein